GGALRVRNVDVQIAASCRFRGNKPFFKNYKKLQWNIQAEEETILEANEESFVKKNQKMKNLTAGIFYMEIKLVSKQLQIRITEHTSSLVPKYRKSKESTALVIMVPSTLQKGNRLYPMGNLKIEVFEEGKKDKTLITLGFASLVEDDQYINTEKELKYLLPLELEEYMEKLWILRMKNGYGEEGVISKELNPKIK
ncbi:MAG: hypothetical protein EZS28_051209, partial [Streblomastix strix]